MPVVAEAQEHMKNNMMKMKKMIIMINVLMTTPSGIAEVILAVTTMIFSRLPVGFTTLKISERMRLAASAEVDLPEEDLNKKEAQDNHSSTNQEAHFLCSPKLLLELCPYLRKAEKT